MTTCVRSVRLHVALLLLDFAAVLPFPCNYNIFNILSCSSLNLKSFVVSAAFRRHRPKRDNFRKDA